jgi:MoxR-like ATPase
MRRLDGTAERPSSVFVGREREWARLRESVAAARDGSGRLALISGEAGIGKTRLVERLAADAGGSGWVVLWSQ